MFQRGFTATSFAIGCVQKKASLLWIGICCKPPRILNPEKTITTTKYNSPFQLRLRNDSTFNGTTSCKEIFRLYNLINKKIKIADKPKNKKVKPKDVVLKTSDGCKKCCKACMLNFDFHSRYKHASPTAVKE